MLTLGITDLPEGIQQLPQPPAKLHIISNDFAPLLQRPRVAIVGTRKLTPYGRKVTEELAYNLAAKGVVIVSGLALGADSVAHTTCIKAGGQTIAVLPSGLQHIYPSSHTNLAKQIIDQGGALVTEFESDHWPRPFEFLQRNRIIAALSEGVIVTEAAARSGSLNTANHALGLGLPVFAVPGNITSPLSEGCNNLIKAGAIPITSVEDVCNALSWKDSAVSQKSAHIYTNEEQTLINLLKQGVSDGAELLAQSKLETRLFNQTLSMLEITGQVRPLGANHWSL